MTTSNTRTPLDIAVSETLRAFAAKPNTTAIRATLEAVADWAYTDDVTMRTQLSAACDPRAVRAAWDALDAEAGDPAARYIARSLAGDWAWALGHLAHGLLSYRPIGGDREALERDLLQRLQETLTHIARITPYPEP